MKPLNEYIRGGLADYEAACNGAKRAGAVLSEVFVPAARGPFQEIVFRFHWLDIAGEFEITERIDLLDLQFIDVEDFVYRAIRDSKP